MSFFASYHSIDNRHLLGGVKESTSSRFELKEQAELRLRASIETNGSHCIGEVKESDAYPEIFIHCGTMSQAIGGKCFGCGKLLTVADAKKKDRENGLFEEAVQGLEEYYSKGVWKKLTPEVLKEIRQAIEIPDTGNDQKDYESVRDQVEKYLDDKMEE